MANNPMFQTAVSPNNATAPSNSVNDAHKKYFRGRNTFDYSRPFYTTARYADITPIEVIHAVEGDILELGSRHVVRSHTLKSPIQSKIFMKKSYVQVDMKAILPRTWNKLYINPTFGDDVNALTVNTYCETFFDYFKRGLVDIKATLSNIYSEQLNEQKNYFNSLWHWLMMYEHVFSDGSPLANLGFHASAMITHQGHSNYFDKALEIFYTDISDFHFKIRTSEGLELKFANLHDFLSYIRYNHDYRVSLVNPSGNNFSDEFLAAEFDKFFELAEEFWQGLDIPTEDIQESSRIPLNYDVLCAYQIACSNFYTRDSVDNVFNAETYREGMDSLARYQIIQSVIGINEGYSEEDLYFDYNGTRVYFDALSGHHLNSILYLLSQSFGSTDDFLWDEEHLLCGYAYFMNIFGYNPSLRYGDYFTGAKPQPLAVGDVTAEVTGQGVNAIDMTVALARARFLNAVNRVGRRPEDYIEDVMDGQLPPEMTEPRFLASATSRVSGFEVENTAQEQGKIVTLLKAGDSNKLYSLAVGHPCIVIGLLTFEIQRVYSRTADRFFFHCDRFDMFNKFMQYIGDQPIGNIERDAGTNSSTLEGNPFAYTLRHMEYKQRYPIASGGFVNFLPGYLFITDKDESRDDDEQPITIDSDYIRSKNYEIDTFYSSLTNYSLAGYYHFILDLDNICIAHRKMEYSPSIL